MNLRASQSAESAPSLCIYFPGVEEVHDFFGHLETDTDLKAEVLAGQHRHERNGKAADRYSRCTCCDNPNARFVVRAKELRGGLTHYCLARFPNSWRHHDPGCYAYKHELPRQHPLTEIKRPLRMGALSALIHDVDDPELEKRTAIASSGSTNANLQGGSSNSNTANLSVLGKRLLDGAGLCTWHPWFRDRRAFREVNGLAWSQLKRMHANHETDPYGACLTEISKSASLGPWTLTALNPRGGPDKALGFGFVTDIGSESESGARQYFLGTTGSTPLLLSAKVLARASRNPHFPVNNDQLRHPFWVMFAAGRHGGIWKAYTVVGFRMTSTGLLPVESDPEEQIVNHLIAEGRSFKRLLFPPPDEDVRFVPDFVLLDTMKPHYIEVAGMTGRDYEHNLRAKKERWGDGLSIWRTNTCLNNFQLPVAC